MGVHISVYKCPTEMFMGYFDFAEFRGDIYDALTKKDKEVSVFSDGTLAFFTQGDCFGRLTPRQSRQFFHDIKDIPDDGKEMAMLALARPYPTSVRC